MPNVAVVLSGCGHQDGAEIREATFTLLALDQAGADVRIFAPDKDQADVVNHVTGEPMKETRNVLVESARIARGDIRSLTELNADDFDAIVFPGGFGAAKNLSDFAEKGAEATVDADVQNVVTAFQNAGKPIGFVCVTPAAIAAPILGQEGVTLTAGSADDPAAKAIETMGAKHEACPVTRAIVDQEHRIVSTPAYMDSDAKPGDVYAGINMLVQEVLGIVKTTEPELTA